MSKDVVGREEMADKDGGSGRRETNSLNGNVNYKCSEFLPMSYVFGQWESIWFAPHFVNLIQCFENMLRSTLDLVLQ